MKTRLSKFQFQIIQIENNLIQIYIKLSVPATMPCDEHKGRKKGDCDTEAMELEHSLAEMTLLEREDEMDADEPEEQMHDHMAIDSIGED